MKCNTSGPWILTRFIYGYPYLNSCAGRDPIKTKNFTYPCKTECFQCYERYWGFGTYDFNIGK